jgi:hypothetical protein
VLPYQESQTPYERTTEGIAVITMVSLLAAALLATAIYLGARFVRNRHL